MRRQTHRNVACTNKDKSDREEPINIGNCTQLTAFRGLGVLEKRDGILFVGLVYGISLQLRFLAVYGS